MKTEKPKKLIRWYILGAIGAVLTILAAGIVVPALPYLLSFAAGAMLYVVVEAVCGGGGADPGNVAGAAL